MFLVIDHWNVNGGVKDVHEYATQAELLAAIMGGTFNKGFTIARKMTLEVRDAVEVAAKEPEKFDTRTMEDEVEVLHLLVAPSASAPS